MKKILLLFVAIVFNSLSFSQELKKLDLTNQGFNSINIKTENTTEENFKKVQIYIDQKFRKDSDQIKSIIQNEKIIIYSRINEAFYIKSLFGKNIHDVSFFLEFVFKENEISIQPQITYFYYKNDIQPQGYNYTTFYDKKGATSKPWIEAENQLEEKFNSIVKDFDYFLLKN
jgi:hypothetical protein